LQPDGQQQQRLAGIEQVHGIARCGTRPPTRQVRQTPSPTRLRMADPVQGAVDSGPGLVAADGPSPLNHEAGRRADQAEPPANGNGE